jgi:hypothetical protein
MGLPSSCTNAEWMLGFVTPPEVSKSFTGPPGARTERGCLYRPATKLELIVVDQHEAVTWTPLVGLIE